MAEEIIEVEKEKPSLLGIITSPTEQFKRIRENPIFWGALIIVTIISVIGMLLTSLGVELPNLNDLTAEEIAIGKVIAGVGVLILGLVSTVVSILFSTVLYLLIARINKSSVTFKQLFSMNTYITLITALSMLVNGIIIALLGSYSGDDLIFTSLGSLVNIDGSLGVLLNQIEIFSIWTMIITVIGLQKVAGFSKSQAWVVVIAFFVVGIIFAVTSV